MTAQQHIIQKIQLDLQCSERRAGQELQFQYQETLQKEVLPGLEELLNEYSHTDELIRIDQLNIDLGNLEPGLLGKSLARKMLAAIEKALKGNLNPVHKSSNLKSIPITQVKLGQLIHFLTKGYWPTSAKDLELEKEVFLLLANDPEQFFAALQKAVKTNGLKVLQRLVLQLPVEALEQIYSLAEKRSPIDSIKIIKTTFFKVIQPNQIKLYRMVWQGIFQLIFSQPKDKPAKAFNLTPELITVCHAAPDLIEELKLAAKKHPELGMNSVLAQLTSKEESFAEFKVQDAIKVGDQFIEKEQNEDVEKIEEGLHGENVGVILLHPFLKSFFDESNLLATDGKFKNTEAAERGVGLLHFLATGQSEAEEHHLAFQKILCDLPLNHPLDRHFNISDAERNESQKMINAAIQYWDALGSTSIQGLQEGFLQRTGVIRQDATGLIVNIEHQTMDILLGKIPWNISMIQLPWMKGLLRVNWTK